MSRILFAIGRKTLGLALIFNSIITLTSAANILASFYVNKFAWRPYSPYLVDGSLFWFVVLTALLNIIPAKLVGKTNLRRIFFHHYVYGFMSIFASVLLIALYAPEYIFILLAPSLGLQTNGFQNIPIYAGLFFTYGGLTLVIDDIYDVSLRLARVFDRIAVKIQRLSKALQMMHLCFSLTSIYVAACTAFWYLENLFWLKDWPLWDFANIIFISNLFVTAFLGLKAVKEKLWFTKFLASFPKKHIEDS